MDGLDVASVRVADDVASASAADRIKRRGVAGMVYAFKLAGARAAEGASLQEVTATAQKAADACRSIGVALTPCVVPESGQASFTIADSEIEFGMGIHGEPGIWRGAMKTADALADEMLSHLLPELPLERGGRVAVLVNSLGATPHEELYILYRRVAQVLAQRGVTPVMPLVGRYATSMEMAGASLTLMPLDAELERLLKAPANCPFWRV
jgi:dihydroxyacetone kinase-like protein